MHRSAALLSIAAAAVRAQQVGTNQAENHPALTWSKCTASGCTSQNGQVVLDANWRWTHTVGGFTNCYTGNEWDTSICDTDESCATACAIDGADYAGTYGITSSGNALTLKFKTGTNIGSRNYLMASETEYEGFTLLNNEFTFDVDVSQLGCGLNGALYFVSMPLDGGMSQFPNNAAGAKYGTGYCDSQCPRDLKFIDGQANIEGWAAESNSANSGRGDHGSCCPEMDIWEANSISEAVTPHPCSSITQTMCTVQDGNCGGTGATDRYAGECDPDGCDFNPFRMGNTTFFGPGKTIDTTQKFTVVTQFPASGSTLTGIKRYFIQNNKVFANPNSDIAGVTGNEITETFCDAQKKAFGDTTSFQDQGGLAQMGKAFAQPMVLVLSLWDDYAVDMLWLDSTYPPTEATTAPGVARGTCATTSGVPADVESQQANAQVIYSNIKFGPIGSTTPGFTLSG